MPLFFSKEFDMSGRKTYPIRYKIRFSENLKKKMREYHLSQADLAKKMEVTRCSVSYWCNGRTIPCGENLEKMAKVFETSPLRLLGYSLEHKESDDIWRNFLETEMPGICRKSIENPFGVS